MAGRDASKCAAAFELEASWAENAGFSAPTRVPFLERLSLANMRKPAIEPVYATQYLNEGNQYLQGPFDNSTFELSFYLAGHGSVTSGATAATVLMTFLKNVFGYAPTPPAGTTITAGWTTTGGNVGASGTIPAGWITFIGAPRDGRADGQPILVTSHIGNAVVAANALPIAPNNTDLLHSSEVVHLPSSPADAQMIIQSTRWQLLTADQCLTARGCFPTAAVLENFGNGQAARVRVTMQASYWEPATTTFPTALSTDFFTAAVNAGGSVHLNVQGTPARALIGWRLMSINMGLGVAVVRGPGGIWEDQTIVAARRIGAPITFDFAEDAESATTTPIRKGQFESGSFFTVVGCMNRRPGKRVAFAAAHCCFSDHTLQDIENGLNITRFSLRAHDDPAGATETAKAAFKLAQA